MKLSKEYNNQDLSILIEGQVDTNTAPELDKFVGAEIGTAKDIILDFKSVDYVSSAGLRVLLGIHKKQVERKANLTLINVNSDIMSIFEMTGFTGFLNIK